MLPRGSSIYGDRAELLKAFEAYIDATEIPIIAEFSYKNGFGKHVLYQYEEFSDALKKCTSKKEAALERKALEESCNITMAIFSLKQLGWSDRNDLTVKGDKAHPLIISPTDAAL